MRLLDSRTLEFKEYVDEESAPEYAILSHTWGDDEVTFKDMQEDRTLAKPKAGFKKIDWCAKQALEDGLDFFWVDTCCIDKSSSAELSEAINSMFRWYRNSKVCYAYLSDVPALEWTFLENSRLPKRGLTKQSEAIFANARWFKRGWTLQELIAPYELVFYSNTWYRIGTKKFLSKLIEKCSSVPETVLHSGDFFKHSVAQRMSWAATRSTTRVEDMSYCLMGLFEINMPLLYGEGSRAFIRLQEEIIKRSDDLSIFVWVDLETKFSTYRGLLAKRPSDFAWCKYVAWDPPEESPEPAITSKGIKLTDINLKPRDGVPHEFVIHFPGVSTDISRLGIYLQRLSKSQFARVDPSLVEIYGLDYRKQDSSSFARKVFGTQSSAIFIRERPVLADLNTSRLGEIRLHFKGGYFDPYSVVPEEGWDKKNKVFIFKNPEELQNNTLIKFLFKSDTTITLDVSKNLESCISAEKPLKGMRRDSKIYFAHRTSLQTQILIAVERKIVNDNHVLQLEMKDGLSDLSLQLL